MRVLNALSVLRRLLRHRLCWPNVHDAGLLKVKPEIRQFLSLICYLLQPLSEVLEDVDHEEEEGDRGNRGRATTAIVLDQVDL
jgi:hypothetical protein